MSAPKKWPDVPDVPGLTLEGIVKHWLYETATDEEIAYSAACTIDEARAARRRLALDSRRRSA